MVTSPSWSSPVDVAGSVATQVVTLTRPVETGATWSDSADARYAYSAMSVGICAHSALMRDWRPVSILSSLS